MSRARRTVENLAAVALLGFGFPAATAASFLVLRAILQPDAWPHDLRGLAWLLVALGAVALPVTAFALYMIRRDRNYWR